MSQNTENASFKDDASSSESASDGQIYRRLLGYSGRFRLFWVLALVGFGSYAASQTALIHLFEVFIDTLKGDSNTPLVYIPIAVMLLALMRGAGFFAGSYAMSRITQGVMDCLRTQVFERFLVLPSSFFEQSSSSDHIALITFNVNQVQESVGSAIKTLLQEGLFVVVLLVWMFWTDWRLTGLFLLLAPVIAAVVSVATKRFRRLSGTIQTSVSDLTQVTAEAVQGHALVKSYGAQSQELTRFKAASQYAARQTTKFDTVKALQTPILQFLLAAVLALLMYIVLHMENQSTGEVVALLMAAGALARPVRALSQISGMVQKGIVAARSIFEVLDTPAENKGGEHTAERVQGDLSFNNVSFAYPQRVSRQGTKEPEITHTISSDSDPEWVLKQINLAVKAGQTLALVGASGSGKSTLVKLVSRFYEVSCGEITLDGISLNQYDLSNLRDQIALVSQDITLFDGSVAENIAYGSLHNRSQEDIRAAAEAANALSFIEQLPRGFDTPVGEGGSSLSGGQRQRISIARALLKDAPILILDEATSALDTESERHIQQALETLMQNRTTLVIAHRLSTIESADCIAVMEQGQIVEQGTHTDLVEKQGVYNKLLQRQTQDSSSLI